LEESSQISAALRGVQKTPMKRRDLSCEIQVASGTTVVAAAFAKKLFSKRRSSLPGSAGSYQRAQRNQRLEHAGVLVDGKLRALPVGVRVQRVMSKRVSGEAIPFYLSQSSSRLSHRFIHNRACARQQRVTRGDQP